MKNLLKADFFRLWKLNSFRVCMALNILISIITILGISLMTKLNMMSGGTFTGMSGIEALIQSLGWAFTSAFFTTVAVTLFVTSSFSNKTQKHPITKGYSRTDVYVSGLIIVSVFSVMMLLAFVFSAALTTSLIWGVGVATLDLISGSIMVLGLQALLHIALASFMYMVAMMIKSTGAAISCNFLILTFAPEIISSLINRFTENFDISIYWIMNNMMFLTNPMPSTVDVARSLMVSVGFFLISTIVGVLNLRKYEFK